MANSAGIVELIDAIEHEVGEPTLRKVRKLRRLLAVAPSVPGGATPQQELDAIRERLAEAKQGGTWQTTAWSEIQRLVFEKHRLAVGGTPPQGEVRTLPSGATFTRFRCPECQSYWDVPSGEKPTNREPEPESHFAGCSRLRAGGGADGHLFTPEQRQRYEAANAAGGGAEPSEKAVAAGSEPFTPENRQRLTEWLRGWMYRDEARPVVLGLLHAHDTEQTMHAAWRKRAEEAEAALHRRTLTPLQAAFAVDAVRGAPPKNSRPDYERIALADLLALHNVGTVAALNAYIGGLEEAAMRQKADDHV